MIQEIGLDLLVRQDNIARGEGMADAFRHALLASGQRPAEKVFPEYFPAAPPVEKVHTDDDLPENVLDEVGTRFDYSEADLDMDAASAEIMALAGVLADNHESVDTEEGWV